MPTVSEEALLTQKILEDKLLELFILESNMIENEFPDIGEPMIQLYRNFINYPLMTVTALNAFVITICPKKGKIRDNFGMDVMVGHHIAPPGSPNMPNILDDHLKSCPRRTPYENHLRYENLHPYLDGNGRSGRALWLREEYQLNGNTVPRRSFLHQFYYDTLANQETRT